MLQNAYFLAKIGADTAENEQHFAEILPIGRRVADRISVRGRRTLASVRVDHLDARFHNAHHRPWRRERNDPQSRLAIPDFFLPDLATFGENSPQ